MAFTLLVNPGSSSKKYSLVQDVRIVNQHRFERGSDAYELCTEVNGEQQKCEGITQEVFSTALRQLLDIYLRTGIISNLQDITTVGIRIVSPGTYFQSHHVIDEAYLIKLREREPAAPLHIPHTLAEIELLRIELPHATIIGISDSAFHFTLPAVARNYSIDAHDTDVFDIHRFGYHGLSVASVLHQYEAHYGLLPARVVVCHVGSGVSMTAVKDGKSIDTSMGFSPDSGLVMGTRAGDLDSGAVFELMRVKNFKLFDALTYVQRSGGLRGLAAESDFRHILERLACKDDVATAALQHFIYRLQKQLGAFQVALGGLDLIILTATASERSATLRTHMLSGLEWLGIELDARLNEELIAADGVITTAGSPVVGMVIRTQELAEMLRVTAAFTAVN